MTTTVDVLARLKADTSGLKSGLKSAEGSVKSFERTVDSASKSASDDMGRVKTSTIALGTALGQVAVMAGTKLLGGLVAAGKGGLQAASDMQQAKVAFTTMLGSAKEADTFLRGMQDFAAKTPFELPGLLSASKQMLAMGFAADEIKPSLTAIGDAAAGLGLGADGIGRITLALGQMKAKGRVMGDDLRQLTEAGVPAIKILADTYGVTTGEMSKMIEKGQVLADQAIPAIVSGLENGTKSVKGFGGMMEAQSKTLMGVISTFKDEARNALVDGLMPALQPLSDALTGLIPAVKSLAGAFGAALGPALTTIATSIGPTLTAAFAQIGPGLAAIFAGLAPVISAGVGLIANLLSGIVALVGPIVQALSPIVTGIVTMVSGIVPKLQAALQPLVGVITGILNAFAPVFSQLIASLMPVVSGLLSSLGSVFQMLAPLVLTLAQALGTFLTGALQALAPYWQQLSTLLGQVLSAVLPPLIDVVMALLNALTPLLPVIVELIGSFAQLIVPILQLVGALTPVFTLGARLLIAVLTPMIGIVGKLLAAYEGWLVRGIKPLIPAFQQGMKVVMGFAATAVRAAAEIVKNFGTMLNFLLTEVFAGILEGAVSAFGWIPGVGDAVRSAQSNFAEFATNTIANINGVSATLQGVAGQLDAMAQGYTIPVTVSVRTVQGPFGGDGRSARAIDAATPTIPAPVVPPVPVIPPGGGGGGGKDKGPDWKALVQSFKEAKQTVAQGLRGFAKALNGSVDEVKSYIDGMQADLKSSFKAAYALITNKKAENALKAVQAKAQDKIDALQARLLQNARDREAIAKQISEASDALAQARADREQAQTAIRDFITKPFGEPSQLDRALDATKVTVDGVLDLYNGLADKVRQRFALLRDANGKLLKGLDQSAAIAKRDSVLKTLQESTAALIGLVKQRDRIAEKLKDAQDKYNDVLSQQSAFSKQATDSIRNAYNELNGLEAAASLGSDGVVKRLQERTKYLQNYAANVKALIAKGVNQDLIRQIVEAGPGASQNLISSLMTASPEQLAAINQSQAQVSALADQFGATMGTKFYGSAVNEAAQYMAGWQSQYDAVAASINTVKDGIEATMQSLTENMNLFGMDAAEAFIAGLETQQDRLFAVAANIGQKIADTIAAAINAAIEAANQAASQAGVPGAGGKVSAGKVNVAKGAKTSTFTSKKKKKGNKAAGGPVLAGATYLVGERGPELFRTPGAGRIVSAQRTQAMLGGTTIEVAPGAVQIVATSADAGEVAAVAQRAVEDALLAAARKAQLVRR